MPQTITTEELQRLVETGHPQLIEVLPRSDYDDEHLPGAISVPLGELTAQAVAELDRDRPIVTYCFDYQCDLSARAAARLESLGFADVYDYRASKVAWLAAGLPSEGAVPAASRAGAIARSVPTCGPGAVIGDIEKLFDDGGPIAVVDDDGIVLGLLRPETSGLPPDTTAEAAMQPAPATVRPSITASELADSMAKDHRTHVLVTTPAGRLLGLIDQDGLHGQH